MWNTRVSDRRLLPSTRWKFFPDCWNWACTLHQVCWEAQIFTRKYMAIMTSPWLNICPGSCCCCCCCFRFHPVGEKLWRWNQGNEPRVLKIWSVIYVHFRRTPLEFFTWWHNKCSHEAINFKLQREIYCISREKYIEKLHLTGYSQQYFFSLYALE